METAPRCRFYSSYALSMGVRILIMKAFIFILRSIIVPALVLAAFPRGDLHADGLYVPIVYPGGRIGSNTPVFIWEDIYTPREVKGGAQFTITVKSRGGNGGPPLAQTFVPELHHSFYYAYRWKNPLTDGSYEYTIERLIGGRPAAARRYHSFSYPARGSFELEARERSPADDLSPAAQVRLLALARENAANNGYNALFFSGAGVICAGVGALFYFVLDLGIAGTIVSALSFASAAAGIGAAGYYGARYLIGQREMKKIAEIDARVSIRGAISGRGFYAAVESKF